MERISVQREVNGDPGPALARLLAVTRDFSTLNGLAERQSYRLCVVVEELGTNAFVHGDARRVSLGLESMGGAVRIAMHDDGGAYDLRSHAAADRPDPESGGGSGLALVQAWCEVIDYRAGRDGNELCLVLRLEQ